MGIALAAEGLSKCYQLGDRKDIFTLTEFLGQALRGKFKKQSASPAPAKDGNFWALKDVSFELEQGKVLGIVGRNGSGKSTLLKILSRITPPTQGRFGFNGTLSSLLEVGTGFKQELSGRDNIFLSGTSLGLKRRDIQAKLDEIIDFAEIETFIDTPVKRYSSGMYVRLAFAVAAHLEPDILLLDEVLAVGDQKFQRKCLQKMRSVAGEGRTVCFVSHNMQAVTQLCQQALLLDGGVMKAHGEVQEVVKAYVEHNRDAGLESGKTVFDRPIKANGAWVSSVELRHGGSTRSHFDLMETVDIEVQVEVEREFGDLQLVFVVASTEGMVLLSSKEPDGLNHSVEKERRELSIATTTGSYCICGQIPAPFLNSGFYELQFHLVGDHSVVIDSRRDIQIEVHDHHNSFTSCINHKRAAGEFVLPITWDRQKN